MMKYSNFYATLPSNASNKEHPQNKPEHYTVVLPITIEFKGEWEVALMEIQYPNNWYNVIEDTTFMIRFYNTRNAESGLGSGDFGNKRKRRAIDEEEPVKKIAKSFPARDAMNKSISIAKDLTAGKSLKTASPATPERRARRDN